MTRTRLSLLARWSLTMGLGLCLVSPPAFAQGGDSPEEKVDKVIDEVVKENERLAKDQKVIDKASEDTEDLLAEWRAVQRRNKALRGYNKQIETLVAAQQEELDQVRAEIEEVAEISRSMTPLMIRMLDGLERFIRLDLPFLLDERNGRIAELRKMMDRADIAESEKFRRLLEAYQIENEYGRTIEAYRDEVTLGEGKASTVDILRIGRLTLLYSSLDGSEAGLYDRDSKVWRPVSAEQRRTIRKGLRMARKQAAPDLLRVPVPAPKDGKLIDVPEAMKR